MQSITVKSHVGTDGVLNLQIPLAVSETDVEVLVVVQPLGPSEPRAAAEAKRWPAGFFEETFGSFSDEPLVRDEQGAYEIRDELA